MAKIIRLAALTTFALLLALLTRTSEFHSENLRGPQVRDTTELRGTTNSTTQVPEDLPVPERSSLRAADDLFGYSVAINGDTAVVGARLADVGA